MANYFTTQAEKSLLEDFIRDEGHKFGSSIETLYAAVSDVNYNLDWSENRLGTLFTYLHKRNNANLVLGSLILICISSFVNLFFV